MTRLLAFLEASTVTGPARNLIEFARLARTSEGCEPVRTEIATFQRGNARTAFMDAVQAADIPLHAIPERGAFDSSVIPRIRDLVATVRADIVQTHAVKSHFLVRLAGVWQHCPWIASHHGYTFTDARTRLYNQLDRWSLRTPARVLTVSEAFRRQLVAAGVPDGRITVLHNAIGAKWGDLVRDQNLRAATRSALGIGDAHKAALIVGRLSGEKAHTDLIRALALLRNSEPGLLVRLMIVGEGPERQRIEAAIGAAGLEGRVIFAGQVDDVKPYYAAADVAVLSSVTEGSPNALLEAMAASVPVVATAVGGIPEIVAHRETALLVPPGNVGAMAQAIGEALTHSEDSLAMVERARALIVSRYSPEQRARFLCRFYSETARAGTRP